MKKILFLYLFYCAVVLDAVSYMPVHLTKLFYHQGTLGDKVVCYFDKAPLCNKIPHVDGEGQKEVREKLEFFLPMAIFASNDARKMLDKVNGIKREHYSIAITEEEKPVKGVKFSIEYDPQHIICDYATCDSISAQKSVVFSFNNKKSLEAIKVHNGAILRSAHNKPGVRPHIMLDFGHGGEDAGKVGCNMVKEKDVTMQIGSRLAQELKKKGYRVSLTRASDTFVGLDDRTFKANENKVDVFLSLHANAAFTPNVSGIETYWTPQNSLPWHCLGNELTFQGLKKSIYTQLDQASKFFAHEVHDHVIKSIAAYYPVTDRKVKESVAQVLFGTERPSALLEMGFLTNQRETLWLTDSSYQQRLIEGIINGIDSYFKKVTTLA